MAGTTKGITECTPDDAWSVLSSEPASVLVDVRTRPEWSFVGVPDLSSVASRLILSEWRRFPDMSVPEDFIEGLAADVSDHPEGPLFFICRSGARSMEAALAVGSWFNARGVERNCINVAGGFEGDLDDRRHRGNVNGWKASGLPWQQK